MRTAVTARITTDVQRCGRCNVCRTPVQYAPFAMHTVRTVLPGLCAGSWLTFYNNEFRVKYRPVTTGTSGYFWAPRDQSLVSARAPCGPRALLAGSACAGRHGWHAPLLELPSLPSYPHGSAQCHGAGLLGSKRRPVGRGALYPDSARIIPRQKRVFYFKIVWRVLGIR